MVFKERLINANNNGELDTNLLENYFRIKREKEHFEATVAEKRKREKNLQKNKKKYFK